MSRRKEALKLSRSIARSIPLGKKKKKTGGGPQLEHAIAKCRRPGVRGKGGRESPVCCGPAVQCTLLARARLVRTANPSSTIHDPSKPPRIPPLWLWQAGRRRGGLERRRAQRRARHAGRVPGPQQPLLPIAAAAGGGAAGTADESYLLPTERKGKKGPKGMRGEGSRRRARWMDEKIASVVV